MGRAAPDGGGGDGAALAADGADYDDARRGLASGSVGARGRADRHGVTVDPGHGAVAAPRRTRSLKENGARMLEHIMTDLAILTRAQRAAPASSFGCGTFCATTSC